jgi:RNA polymerase sigma factor (sigma-70 family)
VADSLIPQNDPVALSLMYLDRLANPDLSDDERTLTFERLLGLRRGWWGDRRLVEAAMSIGLANARKLARPFGLSEDALDWEGAADDGLLALATNTRKLEKPDAWLYGVILNKLRRQRDVRYNELVSRPLTHEPAEEAAARLADDRVEPDREVEHARDLRAQAKIDELPPALRDVARLYLIERQTAQEIAATLNIKYATVRKRLQRLRELVNPEEEGSEP